MPVADLALTVQEQEAVQREHRPDHVFSPPLGPLWAEDRPGHDRRYAMDSGLIRALGWEPETPFAEGLKRTVRRYASNRSWWRKVRTRSL